MVTKSHVHLFNRKNETVVSFHPETLNMKDIATWIFLMMCVRCHVILAQSSRVCRSFEDTNDYEGPNMVCTGGRARAFTKLSPDTNSDASFAPSSGEFPNLDLDMIGTGTLSVDYPACATCWGHSQCIEPEEREETRAIMRIEPNDDIGPGVPSTIHFDFTGCEAVASDYCLKIYLTIPRDSERESSRFSLEVKCVYLFAGPQGPFGPDRGMTVLDVNPTVTMVTEPQQGTHATNTSNGPLLGIAIGLTVGVLIALAVGIIIGYCCIKHRAAHAKNAQQPGGDQLAEISQAVTYDVISEIQSGAIMPTSSVKSTENVYAELDDRDNIVFENNNNEPQVNAVNDFAAGVTSELPNGIPATKPKSVSVERTPGLADSDTDITDNVTYQGPNPYTEIDKSAFHKRRHSDEETNEKSAYPRSGVYIEKPEITTKQQTVSKTAARPAFERLDSETEIIDNDAYEEEQPQPDNATYQRLDSDTELTDNTNYERISDDEADGTTLGTNSAEGPSLRTYARVPKPAPSAPTDDASDGTDSDTEITENPNYSRLSDDAHSGTGIPSSHETELQLGPCEP